jgi:hypothetical protein
LGRELRQYSSLVSICTLRDVTGNDIAHVYGSVDAAEDRVEGHSRRCSLVSTLPRPALLVDLLEPDNRLADLGPTSSADKGHLSSPVEEVKEGPLLLLPPERVLRGELELVLSRTGYRRLTKSVSQLLPSSRTEISTQAWLPQRCTKHPASKTPSTRAKRRGYRSRALGLYWRRGDARRSGARG